MASTVKKKRRRKRKPIDPQKLDRLRQKAKVRSLFARMGFEQIRSDGIEFTFDGRTGELDDIFRFENIWVVCEYTVGKANSAHVSTKALLFSKILDKPAQWIVDYGSSNEALRAAAAKCGYTGNNHRVRIVYISTEGVSEEMQNGYPFIRFLDGTRLRYFESLSHTIQRSARYEFLKYLDLDYREIGEQILRPTTMVTQFSGHLLPEGHSSYPSGFKVVSFYADPGTLLALAYVLRRDSWRDSEGLYQRILIKSKIARMRRYLIEVKRVFVNNIIVTLPANASLNDPDDPGKNIDAASIEHTTQVSIGIPYSANMIGLVDGQHRVFCYYEGKDALEPKIASLRKRQNLLVTGLVFPKLWTEEQKHEFEARLFLEINDNQARARSALKQSIELILDPFSTIAIAKEITNRLAVRGPLADLLQISFFDPPEKIKTTSIVSYGLRPLVKLDGSDSLFTAWSRADKAKLAKESTPSEARKELLGAYLEYCVDCINAFLIAAKMKSGPDKWKLVAKRGAQFVTPTVINGFFVCIRRLAENSQLTTRERYEKKLQGLDAFPFKRFRSSGWKALGDKLYADHFSN